jgi:hypothetical protein
MVLMRGIGPSVRRTRVEQSERPISDACVRLTQAMVSRAIRARVSRKTGRGGIFVCTRNRRIHGANEAIVAGSGLPVFFTDAVKSG